MPRRLSTKWHRDLYFIGKIQSFKLFDFIYCFYDFFFLNYHFRKLTDKPKDEAATAVAYAESIENLEELGKGNNWLLPIFDTVVSSPLSKKTTKQISSDEHFKTEIPKMETTDDTNETVSESHMVMHKGALIDVEKLLQQLNRSEKAREETEIRLSELSKSHAELQSSSSKSKDKIKDLQSELKSYSRKVGDAESSLSSANVRQFIL